MTIYPSSEREINFVVACLRPPLTRNKAFSRRSRAKTGRKCTKKCGARAKLLFCSLNQLFFLPSRCRPRRWILSSPMAELSAVLLDCLKTSQEQQEDTDEKHLPFGVYLHT